VRTSFLLELVADPVTKYQQIFAISQALPGSASVKMIFTINAIHGGYMAGVIAFILFW
jgi:chromate transport protein ChrA